MMDSLKERSDGNQTALGVLQLGLFDPDNPDEVLDWIGQPQPATLQACGMLHEAVADFDRMTAGDKDIGFRLGIFSLVG